MSPEETLKRYPHVVAHLIADSLGYATPALAARIVADAVAGRPNYCEWIASCYGGDARKALQAAIRGRRCHRGYMADSRHALALVRRAIQTGEEPIFASWF